MSETQNFSMTAELDLVPKISDQEIEETLQVLSPVYRYPFGSELQHRFRLIRTDGVDRRNVSYIWNPKLGRLVQLYMSSLNTVDIPSFHVYGAPSLFKPSLAEVCASIRRYVVNWRDFRFFWLHSDLTVDAMIGRYHQTRCTLFGREEEHVIDDKWLADVAKVDRLRL